MPTRPPVACWRCDRGFCELHGKPELLAVPVGIPDKLKTPQDLYQYLYDRWRWRKPVTGLRATCLRHYPLCADPFHEGCHNPSTVADHKIDHHGDEKLFFDFNNLQGLFESCHNRKTRQEHDKRGRNKPSSCPAVLVNGKIQ